LRGKVYNVFWHLQEAFKYSGKVVYKSGYKERKFSIKSSSFSIFSIKLLYKLIDLVYKVIKSKWVVKGEGLKGK
jgi:hypothetical protein